VVKNKGVIYRCVLGCVLLATLIGGACALDNPDAPDLIAEFQQREQVYLAAIDNPKNSTRDFLIAYDDYLLFLDKELHKASEVMMLTLPEARKLELMASQQNWIKYRDTEFKLIENTWTRTDFGSSSGISRGDFRTSIVKDRIMQLLHYAKSF